MGRSLCQSTDSILSFRIFKQSGCPLLKFNCYLHMSSLTSYIFGYLYYSFPFCRCNISIGIKYQNVSHNALLLQIFRTFKCYDNLVWNVIILFISSLIRNIQLVRFLDTRWPQIIMMNWSSLGSFLLWRNQSLLTNFLMLYSARLQLGPQITLVMSGKDHTLVLWSETFFTNKACISLFYLRSIFSLQSEACLGI